MPDELDRADLKAVDRILTNGGSIVRTTVADAHSRPDFMPTKCPHDPKGWERKR